MIHFGNMVKAIDHIFRKMLITHIHANFPYNSGKFRGDIINSPLRFLREQMSPSVSFFLFLILKVISEYTLKEKNANNIEEYSVNLDCPLHCSLAPLLFRGIHCHQFGVHFPSSLSEHIQVFFKTCLVFYLGGKGLGLFGLVLIWV